MIKYDIFLSIRVITKLSMFFCLMRPIFFFKGLFISHALSKKRAWQLILLDNINSISPVYHPGTRSDTAFKHFNATCYPHFSYSPPLNLLPATPTLATCYPSE